MRFILYFVLSFSVAHAQTTPVKLSTLPVKSGAATGSMDSFPMVDATAGTTKRMLLPDMVNIPAFSSTFLKPTAASQTSLWQTISTTLGDLIYSGIAGVPTKLAGNLTTARQFLMSTGNGVTASAPAWSNLIVPTVQKFTTVGAPLTYTTPAGVLYIVATFTSGGAGGYGSGTAAGTAPGAGGISGFNNYQCSGGQVGTFGSTGGTGGICGTASGATVIYSIPGGQGLPGGAASAAGSRYYGGLGGTNPLFGGNNTNDYNSAGAAGTANTGAGGQGGGNNAVASAIAGAGGGSGGVMKILIANPASSYTYAVGAGGTAGGAGTSGFAGGAGATGQVVVEEFYQ